MQKIWVEWKSCCELIYRYDEIKYLYQVTRNPEIVKKWYQQIKYIYELEKVREKQGYFYKTN